MLVDVAESLVPRVRGRIRLIPSQRRQRDKRKRRGEKQTQETNAEADKVNTLDYFSNEELSHGHASKMHTRNTKVNTLRFG